MYFLHRMANQGGIFPKGVFGMRPPEIEKISFPYKYKYKVGRPGLGYWMLCETLWGAIKTWFYYL